MAREHKQELKIYKIEIEKGQKKIEFAKKQYYPDFRATFKWFDNNGISQDEGVGILFGFNVPIWFEKNRSRVSEARNNLQALEFEKKDLENKAFAMINKVYFKIQNSSRTVRLYKETLLPQALKSLNIAETWYKQNKGSFSGILETRSVWLNFNLASERALSDYFQHIAKLEKLIGVNLEIAKNKENR
jgi:outer membrane protein TolC